MDDHQLRAQLLQGGRRVVSSIGREAESKGRRGNPRRPFSFVPWYLMSHDPRWGRSNVQRGHDPSRSLWVHAVMDEGSSTVFSRLVGRKRHRRFRKHSVEALL